MKKLVYALTQGDQGTRISALAAIALAVAAILLLVFSTSTAVNGSLLELPVVDVFLTEDQIDEIEEEYEDYLAELEDLIDEADDEELELFEEEAGMTAEEALDLMDPLSLNSVSELSGAMADKVGMEGEILEIFSLFVSGVTWFGIILMALVALSALFMGKTAFIVSAVLSIPFFLVFVGVIWLVLFIGLCVAYCIFSTAVQRGYNG